MTPVAGTCREHAGFSGISGTFSGMFTPCALDDEVWWDVADLKQRSDPAEMAERYGAEMTVPDLHARLVCSECGGRRVDMVVSGTERR